MADARRLEENAEPLAWKAGLESALGAAAVAGLVVGQDQEEFPAPASVTPCTKEEVTLLVPLDDWELACAGSEVDELWLGGPPGEPEPHWDTPQGG